MSVAELTELCKRHADWRTRIDQFEEDLKAKKAELKKIEYQILSKMEEAEIKTYKIPELGTYTKKTTTSFTLPKTQEERQAYFSYLKERGVFDAMISVNSRTHTKFCKEVIAEMAEIDPLSAVMFEIPGVPGKSAYDSLSITKAKAPRGA